MLQALLVDIAVDIETRFRQITCLGIAWSKSEALCVPFLEVKTADKNYWPELDVEVEIVWKLRELLTHPNVRILGQNFSYDQQYIARRMGFIPNYKPSNFHDTMTAHHVMFAGLPKGLDFLSFLLHLGGSRLLERRRKRVESQTPRRRAPLDL